MRSFIKYAIRDVQEQIKKDSSDLVDEYIWLDYGYEIMMLTDAPDLLELDPITMLQIVSSSLCSNRKKWKQL